MVAQAHEYTATKLGRSVNERGTLTPVRAHSSASVAGRTDSPRGRTALAGQPGSRPGVLHARPSAVYHRSCVDDGGREPVGSQVLGSDVETVARWASAVRVVALHGPLTSDERMDKRTSCAHYAAPWRNSAGRRLSGLLRR